MRAGRRAMLIGGTALVAALAPPAAAGGGPTFDGSCQFAGTVSFSPPITNTAQPVSQFAVGPGTCSGTLTLGDGSTRSLDKAPALYRATSAGQVSCASSQATGTGILAFGARRIHFELTETRGAAAGSLNLQGRRTGDFAGVVAAGGNPVHLIKRCNGPGLRRADVTLSGSTTSPIGG